MTKEEKILEEQLGALGGMPDEGQNPAPERDMPETLGKAKYYGNKHKSEPDDPSKKIVPLGFGDTPTIRGGYIKVDRAELAERSQFYPVDWEFYVKPASVEDIKNWSNIDDESLIQVSETLNEMLRSCLKIKSSSGPVSWNKINSWDKFWFLLKIKEYTFQTGEAKVEFDEDCENCDRPVHYELTSDSLCFDCPSQDLINKYWNSETRCWTIDPNEYDVAGPVFKFYAPTIERDEMLIAWGAAQQNKNKSLKKTFLKFLPWMFNKVAKDPNVNEHFINDARGVYSSWNQDLFGLADDIIRNITIQPYEKLRAKCDHCGEVVETDIRFPNGVKCLFVNESRHKKFGEK